MSEVQEYSRSKPTSFDYIRKIPRDDWRSEMSGFVITDAGYVHVQAFWMRPGRKRKRWEQHIVLRRMEGDIEVWGRAMRPESRALSRRGLTIMARKWVKEGA